MLKRAKRFKNFSPELIALILRGGIGVLPTDTIYGLVGLALSKETVKQLYQLRRRNPLKPFIILIADISDLQLFNIKLSSSGRVILNKYWPGKISFILSCPDRKLSYLHRNTKSLAFRLPKDRKLINLLKKTGPLIAPSANLEGKKPADTIKEAYGYFKDKIDFYVDKGALKSKPSTLVSLNKGKLQILRLGAIKINI